MCDELIAEYTKIRGRMNDISNTLTEKYQDTVEKFFDEEELEELGKVLDKLPYGSDIYNLTNSLYRHLKDEIESIPTNLIDAYGQHEKRMGLCTLQYWLEFKFGLKGIECGFDIQYNYHFGNGPFGEGNYRTLFIMWFLDGKVYEIEMSEEEMESIQTFNQFYDYIIAQPKIEMEDE